MLHWNVCRQGVRLGMSGASPRRIQKTETLEDRQTRRHCENYMKGDDMDVFERHQLKIAKATLKMSDVGASIMGGMTKEEARAVILKLTGKIATEN